MKCKFKFSKKEGQTLIQQAIVHLSTYPMIIMYYVTYLSLSFRVSELSEFGVHVSSKKSSNDCIITLCGDDMMTLRQPLNKCRVSK